MRALLLALVLAAAGLAQDSTTLTLADNHKRFTLHVGQKLQLQLPANPTTGLAWELVYKNSQLKPLGKPVYVPTQPKKPKLGGSLNWTWQVAGEFDDSLELSYRKAAGKKPVRTFLVRLNAVP